MNANARAWIQALRSGSYPQTKGVLRDERGYCCLGVACELAVEAGVIEPPLFAHPNDGRFFYEGCDTILPLAVKNWLGLRSREGHFNGINRSLSFLNDGAGATFKQIANVIKSEPKGLFNDNA